MRVCKRKWDVCVWYRLKSTVTWMICSKWLKSWRLVILSWSKIRSSSNGCCTRPSSHWWVPTWRYIIWGRGLVCRLLRLISYNRALLYLISKQSKQIRVLVRRCFKDHRVAFPATNRHPIKIEMKPVNMMAILCSRAVCIKHTQTDNDYD